MALTGHVQLSGSGDKLSGLGLVSPAHVDAGMVAPCVSDHQVCREDDHVSRDGFSIWSKEKATEDSLASQRRNSRGGQPSAAWAVVTQVGQQVAL